MNNNKIVIGSAQFGMNYGISNKYGLTSLIELNKILKLARNNGIYNIDTARAYNYSEARIGEVISRNKKIKWKITTKIIDSKIDFFDQIIDSKKKLGVMPSFILAHSTDIFFNKSFQDVMNRLKGEGVIEKTGVSVYSSSEISKILNSSFKPDIVQVPINILDTRLYWNQMLNFLKEANIEIHARSVFLQGLFYLSESDLRQKFLDVLPYIKKLNNIALKYNLNLPDLSLLWLINLKMIDKIIVGIDKEIQLKEHLNTITKEVDPIAFELATSLKYENEKILNPKSWDNKILTDRQDIKTLAIIQARMGSIRFPGKVLETINDKTLIEILFSRLSKSQYIDKIILATTDNPINDVLSEKIQSLGYDVFRGSENNVLKRYYMAAKQYSPLTVIRITGDCPIIDSSLVDAVIDLFNKSNVDYASNNHPPTYPNGLDTEVFSFQALKESYEQATSNHDLEHVTPFILREEKFKKITLKNDFDYSDERWTVDEKEDYKVIKNIINHFNPNIFFNWKDVLKLKDKQPNYFLPNAHIPRDEGSDLGHGQKLYKRAKKVIPGGTMLLSKRPEMFLPTFWPSYYSKAKGCLVWDLEGNKYIDMSIMGIGTNTLGYGQDEIDEAVHDVVKKGNLSTLNCPEEVYLAERLTQIHPWADMVRFARTGGEANAIAMRIARAASGRDKVAICGYHGWHDWYLAANLGNDSSLNEHLLSGLQPKGVPKNLRNTVYPFKYNDFEYLENIVRENDIGVIKMEVSRSQQPQKGFLESVRKLADSKSIPLIFDECTSGFRETFGGLHKKYKVIPDLIMLGKTLGNGYAISAVVGKEEIMKFAQDTFISSTFWTERIGPTAALKTLEIMEREKSWNIITDKGKMIKKRWKSLSKKYDLLLETNGLPALISFIIPSKNWLKYKTLISQEMLKEGFLAANSIYSCTAHTDTFIDSYFQSLENVFEIISRCENNKLNIDDIIQGPICHAGFERLN